MPHLVDYRNGRESAFACLALIAHFHQIAADPAQLLHEFGGVDPTPGTDELLRCAKGLGLKTRLFRNLETKKLSTAPLPAIARMSDGHFVVIAKFGGDKILLQDPREQRPQSVPLQLFEKNWTGELLLLTHRHRPAKATGRFNIRWFLPTMYKYRRYFGEVLLASFFLQLFALATPLFFQVVIDKVLVHGGLTTLDVLAVGLLAISVFEVLLTTLRNFLLAHTSNRIDVTLGAKLFQHLLCLPTSYFKARCVGDTVARVRELDTIRQLITGSSLTVVIDLLFTVIFFVLMYCYSPRLFLIVLLSLPFYIVLSLILTPLLRDKLQKKFQRGAENQAFLVEAVHGIDTVKSMAVEPQMQRHWENQLAAYVSASFSASKLGNIGSQLAGLVSKLCSILILWSGATLVIGGSLSVGQLIAFNMFAARVSAPVLRLVQLWQDFQQAGIAIERLGDILNAPTEPGYNPNRNSLPRLQGCIELDHVSFRYQADSSDVLQDISVRLEAGEVVGIVGQSGSGKSTLTNLIQRLYTPCQGRVSIDGIDLALVQTAWLRRQIGVVQQESFLFNRSVRENIALVNPDTGLETIIAAAKIAGAHEFICELPEGYDTLVGEQGGRLSGGQKQRLAIARALIEDPRILIFDEATSALDYESEFKIQQNMNSICKDRTVLIVAHRLSTVRHADRILVMDKGRIVEQGSHQQLLARGGIYARLYAYQGGLAERA